ncbi:serine/threonine-protein kinase [Streptosporangium sp. KLBMP 9127]|nr:protein kinase [Streptosporangium sp. KLBMP 9127]
MFGMPSAWQVPGFTEIRELGSGVSGRVVMARHDTDGLMVAIKYLSDELREDVGFVARFRREARLLESLDDPQVARLYQYVESGEGAAIVMELVDGVALRALLRTEGPTGPEAALTILKGALLGLATAHAAGVVHRDFKPENIMVGDDGASKLVDFGIAVRSGEGGSAAGTPPYMAPEQWTGAPAGPATDVYAATVVFFECLTGNRPFRSRNLAALAHDHQSTPPPVEEIPPPLQSFVERGLAKQPAGRPPTAAAFLTELEAVAADAYGPDWERKGRRRLAALAGLLALQFPLANQPPGFDTSLAETRLGDNSGHARNTGRARNTERGGNFGADAEPNLAAELADVPLRRLGVKIAVGVGCVAMVTVVAIALLNSGGEDPELRAQTSTATPTVSLSPAEEPTADPTPEPSEPVAEEPSPTPTATVSAAPTTALPPVPTSTPTPSAKPSKTPSKKPTEKPAKKPTPKPTPSSEATPSPTPEPSISYGGPEDPKPRPTPTPTPSITSPPPQPPRPSQPTTPPPTPTQTTPTKTENPQATGEISPSAPATPTLPQSPSENPSENPSESTGTAPRIDVRLSLGGPVTRSPSADAEPGHRLDVELSLSGPGRSPSEGTEPAPRLDAGLSLGELSLLGLVTAGLVPFTLARKQGRHRRRR